MATVDAEVVKRIGERPQKKEKGKAAPVKKEEKTAANAPPQVNEEELNPAVRFLPTHSNSYLFF